MSFQQDLDAGRASALEAVRRAGRDWAAAMRAHKLAPPDAGFATRLRELAEAAKAEAQAWQQAPQVGLLWRPIPGAEHAQPPYELRPGTGRRGPADLWTEFDEAVSVLNRAIAGSDAGTVADAFGQIGGIAAQLAAAVEREDAGAAASNPDDASRTVAHARARGAA